MKLNSIQIQNFRKFGNFELSFENLNIIFGNNEAGKSTIIDAIISALFVDAATSSKVFFETSKHWASSQKPILKLTFVQNEIEYSLTRDFNSKLNELKRLNDNRVETSADLIKKQISTWLGIVHEDIFRTIGVLSGHEMAKVDNIQKLTDELQKIISGSSNNVNTTKIIANLTKQIGEITLGMNNRSANSGIMKQLADKIGRLDFELNEKRTQFKNYIESLKLKDDSTLKLAEIKKKITEVDEIIKKNELLEKSNESLLEIKNKIEVIQKDILETSNLQAQYLELNRTIENSEFNYNTYNRFNTELTEVKNQIAINEAERSEIERKIESKKIYIEENKKFKSKESRSVVITGIIFTMILTLIFILLQWWPLLIASAISFLILYLYPKFTKTSYESDEKFIEKLQDALSDKKDKITDLQHEVKNIFNQLGIKEENEFYEKKVDIESKFENINQIVKYISVKLNSGNNSANLNQKFSLEELDNYINSKRKNLDELLLKKREIEVAEIDKYKIFRISSQELLAKQQELDGLYEEKSQLEEQQITAKVRVGDSNIDEEKVKLLEEEYELTLAQYRKQEQNLKALNLTKDTLELAQRNTAKSSSTVLKLEVEKYLAKITNGEYSQIEINDKLEVKVFSKKKKDWIDPKVLSTGTISQVFMLLKIAYFQLLSNSQNTPIFLDDPFITFDQTRKNNSLELLSELVATGNQIILLTCDSELPKSQELKF